MPADWSQVEVEALVADYIHMLDTELRGEQYSKTAHRRALAPLLNGRPDGSIERKHQNVSAILIELGYPYIFGYKPLGNYQRLLYEVTAERVSSDARLASTVRAAVEAPASPVAPSEGLLELWEEPPKPAEPLAYTPSRERPPTPRPPVNYLEREARNASLGRAGEEFVIRFERERLVAAGREALADQIVHVAAVEGDGAGFDVRSFEPNGKDRLIEVKTTAYGKQTPFFLSRNELHVSQQRSDTYHLYRLFRFREAPRLFGIRGALEQACRLEAVQYSARVK